MYAIKKIFFKLLELGLGFRPCFYLETENPIFINFRLSKPEQEKVQEDLPVGFRLTPVSFFKEEPTPAYWVSYNFYEIRYPGKALASLRKVRCEINTFVTDALGRRGIFVFCGSPFVSKEQRRTLIGWIADLAERLVIWIYGAGRLLPLEYVLDQRHLRLHLNTPDHEIMFDGQLAGGKEGMSRLADDYLIHNDISFFNAGSTYDLVNNNSRFALATFTQMPAEQYQFKVKGPFFERKPDGVYYHLGEISYLVSALNKNVPECFV